MVNPDDVTGRAQPPGRLHWFDLGLPVTVFVFCAAVIHLSMTFEEVPEIIVGDSMQPRVFPIFLMVVMGLLNIALILQITRTPPKRLELEPKVTWFSVVLMGVFYILAEHVDMMLALPAVLFCMCRLWGETRLWVAGLAAVITTCAIFFSFDLVLEVRFPRGVLTNIYYG